MLIILQILGAETVSFLDSTKLATSGPRIEPACTSETGLESEAMSAVSMIRERNVSVIRFSD